MSFNPGDLVFNKIENELQLVIEVEPAREFLGHTGFEVQTMAHDGEMLWYPVGFLVGPSKKAGDNETW